MSEYRAIMTGVYLLCGLACASGIWPLVERITTAAFVALLALSGLAVAGYLGRELVRELRFRAEMRALDRRDATCAPDARIGAPR